MDAHVISSAELLEIKPHSTKAAIVHANILFVLLGITFFSLFKICHKTSIGTHFSSPLAARLCFISGKQPLSYAWFQICFLHFVPFARSLRSSFLQHPVRGLLLYLFS
jgi:hypothetical protein